MKNQLGVDFFWLLETFTIPNVIQIMWFKYV